MRGFGVYLRSPFWLRDRAFLFLNGGYFVLCLALGGGTQQGFFSDAILQLLGLPLLVVALLRLPSIAIPRVPLFVLCLVVALPLAQLVPLSPAIWTSLPGREELVRAYETAGVSLPWLPISLSPNVTWRSAVSLIPPMTLFLSLLSLSDRMRRAIVVVMLIFAFVAVVLGLLQVMGGTESPLRFFAVTNASRAVGFFANSNHQAALLYCAIPFAAAYAIQLAQSDGRYRGILLFLVAILLASLFVGIAATRSRAGLALAIVAGLCSITLLFGKGRPLATKVLGAAVGANLIAAFIAFQFGFLGIEQRFQAEGGLGNFRSKISEVTVQALQANLPFGTGFGTFVPLYERFEPRTLLGDKYINRAHNDWLEIGLEGGLPAAAVGLIFLAWFTVSGLRLWLKSPDAAVSEIEHGLARAGWIAILLLLAHSLVDYPLRTTALMALVALACALSSSSSLSKTAS